MYEDCQGTEYAVPGIVPVLCQWEPRPVWGGDSPVVKSADSNAVFAAPVNICHTTGSALIDKFQLFFFWNSGFSGVCLILLLVSVCSPYSPFVKRKRLSPLSDIYFSS